MHHPHRDGHRRAQLQHPHHRGCRPDGPRPAVPDQRPCGPLWPESLRLLHLPAGQDPHRHRPEAAFRHPGVHSLRLRLPHRHARPTNSRRRQSAGPQPARPHGGRGLRPLRQDAGTGHRPGQGRTPPAGQERVPRGSAGRRLHPREVYRRRPGPHRGLQAHRRHPDPRGRRRRAG